ncbi:MAG: hypothetical protein ACRC23_02000 [Aeromonas jandaei]
MKKTFNIYDIRKEVLSLNALQFNKNNANFYIEMNPDTGKVCARLEFVRNSIHDKCYTKDEIAAINNKFEGQEFIKFNNLIEEVVTLTEYLRASSYIKIVEVSDKHNPFASYINCSYEHTHALLDYGDMLIPCRIAKCGDEYHVTSPEEYTVHTNLMEAIMKFVLKVSAYSVHMLVGELNHLRDAKKENDNEANKDQKQDTL